MVLEFVFVFEFFSSHLPTNPEPIDVNTRHFSLLPFFAYGSDPSVHLLPFTSYRDVQPKVLTQSHPKYDDPKQSMQYRGKQDTPGL